MLTRCYRVNLIVDIYLDAESESDWIEVEGDLEEALEWECFHDLGVAYAKYCDVDSYTEES